MLRSARETSPRMRGGVPEGRGGVAGHATTNTVEDRGRVIVQTAQGAISRAVAAPTWCAHGVRHETTLHLPGFGVANSLTGAAFLSKCNSLKNKSRQIARKGARR